MVPLTGLPCQSAPKKTKNVPTICYVLTFWAPISHTIFVMKIVSNNLINYRPWNLQKFLIELVNSEAPVLVNFLINFLGELFILDCWPSRTFFIINILPSFIENPTPFRQISVIHNHTICSGSHHSFSPLPYTSTSCWWNVSITNYLSI